MLALASHRQTLFIGQNVVYSGNVMYSHLEGVPMEQRIELPVAEELQLGMTTGLAIQGFLPISIYPRFDFLMRAMDQLVNHIDKIETMSCGQFKPKVIIRTRVGSKTPLDAGPQHTQDHSEALRLMLTNVVVEKIVEPGDILPVYEAALKRTKSTLVVEALNC